MKKLMIASTLLLIATSQVSYADDAKEQIHYYGDAQKSFEGPENLFTGKVKVDMLFPENETANYSAAYVHFDAGAHTAWHEHPAGQHMIVVKGTALTGTRDGKVVKFTEGEAVWCPPGIDHWHGATKHEAMTHLVVTASANDKNVIWKEKLTPEQYDAAQ